MSDELNRLIRQLDYGFPSLPRTKRRVFVSYQHSLDQDWSDVFATVAAELDVFTNRSLHEPIDSGDTDYVHRAIRERNITGSSVTIVLCGAETWKRKWIDWEIGSTVNKLHGLLGIALPTALRRTDGILVPDRFYDNWRTGYAEWVLWEQLTAAELWAAIERAVVRASRFAPDTGRPFMARNMP